MAEVTHAPSGPTTSTPAFLPVPFHFLFGAALLVLAGGLSEARYNLMAAGGVVYLAIGASFIGAILNSVLLARLGRGSDAPVFLIVLIALSPWFFGLLGTMLGLRMVASAVEHVNPADKATILAAGFSEAINNRMIGAWFAAGQLAAVGIGLGLVAHSRAGAAKNTSGAALAGGAVLALFAAGAAVPTLGAQSVATMVIPAIALGAALFFGGLGASGEERSISVVAGAAFAAAAAFAAVSVSVVAAATSRMLSALASVEASDKFTILGMGALELAQGQLFLRAGALIAFAAAGGVALLAFKRAAQSGPHPLAFVLPAIAALGMAALDVGVNSAGMKIVSSPALAGPSVDVDARDLVELQSHTGSGGVRGVLARSGELDFGGGRRVALSDSAEINRALAQDADMAEWTEPSIAVEKGATTRQLLSLLTAVHLAGADGLAVVGRSAGTLSADAAAQRDAALEMFPFVGELASGLQSLPLHTRGYVSESRRITHRATLSSAATVTVESDDGVDSFELPTTPEHYGWREEPPGNIRRGSYDSLVELRMSQDVPLEKVLATAGNLWALNYRIVVTEAAER